MWFNPAELLSKTPCPLAIPATLRFSAEIEPEKSQNRKNRSPVELGITNAETVEELQAYDPGALQAETDTAANDPTKSTVASCGQCMHFKCFNNHGRGAGTCNAGVQSPGVNWWFDTQHQCDNFTTKFVICYNPLGKAFEVEARDAEHAAFLIRMNLKLTGN
ncbi:MAG: hypothetical protein U1C59_15140 [Methylotenera sp.]|jgi:hypothetical protein|nr:hypothetical protein [Methylotenera sp.]